MEGESSRPAHYKRNRTDSKFKQACDAIKSGDLSVRQAANKFGFSKSTLHDAVTKRHVKRRKKKLDVPPGKSVRSGHTTFSDTSSDSNIDSPGEEPECPPPTSKAVKSKSKGAPRKKQATGTGTGTRSCAGSTSTTGRPEPPVPVRTLRASRREPMAQEMDEQDLGAPTEASSEEPDTAEADTDAVVLTDTDVPVGTI